MKKDTPKVIKKEANNVLKIYNVVLRGENVDSDYWNEDHGSLDLIHIFEENFTKNDWIALALDLNNWSTEQLELFIQGILGGYSGFTNNGIYYYNDKEAILEITKTIPYRFDLLFPILQIENDRKELYNPLSCEIIENINFINDHFDILLAIDLGYLDKIRTILELLKLSDSKHEIVIELRAKIDNSSKSP
ncbi:MAG: hypothetical protein GQ574_11980 [Crocinitomix sp.]|nr:hypothetical protein [Crocinitomix sp.]